MKPWALMALIWLSASPPGIPSLACASETERHPPADIAGFAYSLADHLVENLLVRLDRTAPLIVTSIGCLDDPERITPFGYLLGDLMASRMTRHGYTIIELRMNRKDELAWRSGGFSALTRNIRDMRPGADVQAVVTGTWTRTGNGLIVSVKIVEARTSVVLSSHDARLNEDPRFRSLTRDSSPYKPRRMLTDGSVLLQTSHAGSARRIQRRLGELGYYSGGLDGVWGSASREALRRFKRSSGLPGNTRWNLLTQKRLFRDAGD